MKKNVLIRLVLGLTILCSEGVYASICDGEFSSDTSRKFECHTTDQDTQIVTKEDRLIFISQLVCAEMHEGIMVINLINPGNGKHELKIKSVNSNELIAEKSENVFPSGDFSKMYTANETLSLTNPNSEKPNLVFTISDKRWFKTVIKYIGHYQCNEVK